MKATPAALTRRQICHPLLSTGNTKLGSDSNIWSFGLPAVETCPGRSPLCEEHCYARRGRYHLPTIKQKEQQNWSAARSPWFVVRVLQELAVRRVKVLRVHDAGDFFSASYAFKWLRIFREAPHVRFYFYTRSWRVPAIAEVLARMAKLPNVRAWFSVDDATGMPAKRWLGPNVRIAYMQTSGPPARPVDLVFRVHPLRQTVAKRVAGAVVCPLENGIDYPDLSCSTCALCLPSQGKDPRDMARFSLPVIKLPQNRPNQPTLKVGNTVRQATAS